MRLACRVQWSWVDRAATVNMLTTRSKMLRQRLKCSLTAPRRAGTSSGCFFLVSFNSAGCLSLGDLVQRCLGQPVDLLALWPSAAVIPRRRSTAVHFQSVERRVQRNLEGLANVRLDELTVVRRHWLFFFQWCLRGEGARRTRREGRQILRWRHSNCPLPMHAEERLRGCSQRHSEVRAGRLREPFQAESVSHRTDWTSLKSKRTPRDFSRRLFLYPVPSAAARTAPNGVKEGASFCLVFRSLNTASSHRMFSMGYRRAKSTQGNTNFQKRIFSWQTTSGSLPAGLKLGILSLWQRNSKRKHFFFVQESYMLNDGRFLNFFLPILQCLTQ